MMEDTGNKMKRNSGRPRASDGTLFVSLCPNSEVLQILEETNSPPNMLTQNVAIIRLYLEIKLYLSGLAGRPAAPFPPFSISLFRIVSKFIEALVEPCHVAMFGQPLESVPNVRPRVVLLGGDIRRRTPTFPEHC
jgi:hypothetical protein